MGFPSKIFLYERGVRLRLPGDEELAASMVIGAGSWRLCSHCCFGEAEVSSSLGRWGRWGLDFGGCSYPVANVAGLSAGFLW